MQDDEDDLYDAVNAMADRIGLTDPQERRKYVHQHMTMAGYDAVPTYVRRQEDDDDDAGGGSGFFGTRSRRPADKPRQPRRQQREDDWYTG